MVMMSTVDDAHLRHVAKSWQMQVVIWPLEEALPVVRACSAWRRYM
jgi:hypothetical protein